MNLPWNRQPRLERTPFIRHLLPVIVRGNDILLVRHEMPYGTRYSLESLRVDPGEKVVSVGVAAIKDEMGITAEYVRPLGAIGNGPDQDMHILFRGVGNEEPLPASQDAEDPTDVRSYEWVSRDSLAGLSYRSETTYERILSCMDDEYPEEDILEAETHLKNHRDEMNRSEFCGCVRCLTMFSTDWITTWYDDDKDGVADCAVCPYCKEDGLIGDDSPFPINCGLLYAVGRYQKPSV